MTIQKNIQPRKIALIRARWHANIVDRCVDAFRAEWEQLEGLNDQIEVFDVPGALEIPLHAQTIARSGQFAAIIGCAFVVNGGIYRHDFVASTVLDAMMRVQLDAEVPVLSAVLTPHNFQESHELTAFFEEHFVLKGREVAQAGSMILRERRLIASRVYDA